MSQHDGGVRASFWACSTCYIEVNRLWLFLEMIPLYEGLCWSNISAAAIVLHHRSVCVQGSLLPCRGQFYFVDKTCKATTERGELGCRNSESKGCSLVWSLWQIYLSASLSQVCLCNKSNTSKDKLVDWSIFYCFRSQKKYIGYVLFDQCLTCLEVFFYCIS